MTRTLGRAVCSAMALSTKELRTHPVRLSISSLGHQIGEFLQIVHQHLADGLSVMLH